jgi:hypothetical protein
MLNRIGSVFWWTNRSGREQIENLRCAWQEGIPSRDAGEIDSPIRVRRRYGGEVPQ